MVISAIMMIAGPRIGSERGMQAGDGSPESARSRWWQSDERSIIALCPLRHGNQAEADLSLH